MATQTVILNGDSILVDDSFLIAWADKGKNWVDAWCPNTIHCVLWNNLPGQNEIQTKDPATGNMAGNTDLNATSDAVGSTTIADLLVWAETRQLQINEAEIAWEADGTPTDKSWRDYDSNYS